MTRKIKVVSIDGDGCLFAYTKIGSACHSSWDAVAFAYGLKEKWDERAQKYVANRNQSDVWAIEDAGDLRGKPVRDADPILYPIPYCDGAREFLAATKGRLIRGLLSGCLDLVGKRAAREMDLDFCYCNSLHAENGVFSGRIDYDVPVWHKHLFIPRICEAHRVTPEEVCHVGDHENDIDCFARAGLAVAFRPKLAKVAKAAKYVIDDFRELNRILAMD